mmetsp:Transcript_14501/g.24803  ORF Transcript_14501/g.24803 Transcript_14501/m.24803 type:complete len:249 (+) Transcript_14501:3-749(+)
MARFTNYEEEFRHVCNTLRMKMKQINSLSGERKKLAIREAEREVDEAEDIIRQMRTYLQQHHAPSLESKVTTYTNDLSRLKRDFEKTAKSGNNRADLLGGGKDDFAVRSLDQRTSLLNDRRTLQDGSDRLQNARAISERTEQIGADVLTNLDSQRNQLIRADDALSNVDGDLSRSRRILRAMDRRVMTNKLVLVCIIIALMGLIVLIIYLRWGAQIIGSGGKTTTTTTAAMTTTKKMLQQFTQSPQTQ